MAAFLDILICGYCDHLILPKDIITLITSYYPTEFGYNLYLLSTHNLTLHKITSPYIKYDIKLNHYKFITNKYEKYTAHFKSRPKCIINHTSLPPIIQSSESVDYAQNIRESTRWSLIFQAKRQQYLPAPSWLYLTAIHSYNMSDDTCMTYNFALPPITKENKYKYGQSMIYNETNTTLYATGSSNMYSLSFEDKNYKWKRFKYPLRYKRANSALCMVDKDRFIAVIGGVKSDEERKRVWCHRHPTKYAELLSLDCGISIKLKDMNRAKRNPLSIYNDKYHEIIVSDEGGYNNSLERYDLNKDEWISMMINDNYQDRFPLKDVIEMYIQQDNPNIINFLGIRQHELYNPTNPEDFVVYQLDSRNVAQGYHEICSRSCYRMTNKLYFSDGVCCVRL